MKRWILPLLFACGQAPDEPVTTYFENEILVEAPEYTERIMIGEGFEQMVTYGVMVDMDTGVMEQWVFDSDVELHDGEPGWIRAEDKSVCQGTDRACFPCQGGQGCNPVADNSNHTYCNLLEPNNSDMGAVTPGIKFNLNWLNNHNEVLPTGYGLAHRGPHPTFQPFKCAGITTCPGGEDCITPVDPAQYPTKTDLFYQKRTLANTPNSYCLLPRCPGASCPVPGNKAWLACMGSKTSPSIFTWNNDFVTNEFRRGSGNLVTFDDAAITTVANSNQTDPYHDAESKEFLYMHFNCTMVGRTIGLMPITTSPGIVTSCMDADRPTIADTYQGWDEFDTLELRNTYESFVDPWGNYWPKYFAGPPRGTVEL